MNRPSTVAQPLALTGLANYSPGPAVDNATLEAVLQAPVRSVMAYFGVEARHYVIDPRTGKELEPGLGTTEMSVRAGRKALAGAGLEADAIDTLICATSTPDGRLPPLTHDVQRGLGMEDVQMYDLRGGCAVAMQALALASALLESGRARRVLVTLADTLSRHFLTPLLGQNDPRTEDLVNALTFADGAAAAVVEAAREGDRAFRLLNVSARSRFAHRAHGFGVDGDGQTLHNHRAIREQLPHVMQEAVQTLLASNRDAGERPIDHLIVPQVNRSMLNLVQSELHDRVYYVGHRIGNCPAPAILRALALAIEEGVFAPGSANVGVIGIETASWTFGTALLR
jgi:3-oxoacyl-[acyl-carrier-protein] synthase III